MTEHPHAIGANDPLARARAGVLAALERAMLDADLETDPHRARARLHAVFTQAALEYGAISVGAIIADADADLEKALAAAGGTRDVLATTVPVLSDAADLSEAVHADAAAHLAEAEERGDLPHGLSRVLPVMARRWAAQQAEPTSDVADVLRRQLDETGWNWVFHATRAGRLTSIARLGIVDGGIVDLLGEDPDGPDDRRAHGDAEKQDRLYDRTFFSFWPPWWLFTRGHYGTRDAVLLAVDASAVCSQRDAIFVPKAVRSASVTGQYLQRCSTSSSTPLLGWDACWSSGRPIINAEIIANRVHPREIEAVMFASDADRERWWPSFAASLTRAYPHLDANERPRPAGRSLTQAGRIMSFPPSYQGGTVPF